MNREEWEAWIADEFSFKNFLIAVCQLCAALLMMFAGLWGIIIFLGWMNSL